jgi:hypothetical protein
VVDWLTSQGSNLLGRHHHKAHGFKTILGRLPKLSGKPAKYRGFRSRRTSEVPAVSFCFLFSFFWDAGLASRVHISPTREMTFALEAPPLKRLHTSGRLVISCPWGRASAPPSHNTLSSSPVLCTVCRNSGTFIWFCSPGLPSVVTRV